MTLLSIYHLKTCFSFCGMCESSTKKLLRPNYYIFLLNPRFDYYFVFLHVTKWWKNTDLLISLSISNAHLVQQWSNEFIRFVKNCLRIFSCLKHNYNLDDSVASSWRNWSISIRCHYLFPIYLISYPPHGRSQILAPVL